jgi:hypothetical protein
MKKEYEEWIAANVTDGGLGQCQEVTEQMLAAFPELIRVRGHYACHIWGPREHWWLDDDGVIVDPTAEQFPSKGAGVYIPWEEGREEPTGKCMNCGDYCYGGSFFCSDACEATVMADFA